LLRFCELGKNEGKISAVLRREKAANFCSRHAGFESVAIEATIPAVSLQKEQHMIIGNFQTQNDGYNGTIHMIGFSADVRFAPNTAKTGNGPDFAVRICSCERGDFDLGAAWRKTSKKGRAYLSVKLDSPALAQPINCALTQQQDSSHALVWNRRDEADEQD
jgi:uncharacterized protein (DUF736 family)